MYGLLLKIKYLFYIHCIRKWPCMCKLDYKFSYKSKTRFMLNIYAIIFNPGIKVHLPLFGINNFSSINAIFGRRISFTPLIHQYQ